MRPRPLRSESTTGLFSDARLANRFDHDHPQAQEEFRFAQFVDGFIRGVLLYRPFVVRE